MTTLRAGPVLLAAVAVAAAGCAAPPTATELRIPPGRYALAFDAARDALRDHRFDLNRVDGHAGVISTYVKPSAGLLSPWDGEQSSLGQEVEDLLNYQQRRVRVTFEPAEPPAPAPAEPGAAGVEPSSPGDSGGSDIPTLARSAETIMRIRVTVERIHRPTWRPDPSSVNLSTRSNDPDLGRRGLRPSYAVPVADDRALAARLVEDVRRRMAAARPARE
jgi:hypothetical protein